MQIAAVPWCPTPTGAAAFHTERRGVKPTVKITVGDRHAGGPCGITGLVGLQPLAVAVSFANCPKCGRVKIRRRRDILRCPRCGSLPISIEGTIHRKRSGPEKKKQEKQ